MTTDRPQSPEERSSDTPVSREKQAGFEKDIDFAHTVASTLNRLIDEAVLNAESVGNASRETMEEFIIRFKGILKPDASGVEELTPPYRALLKTMFGEAQPEEKPGKNPDRKETIEIMESFWQQVKEHGIPVRGFLLYGSRMDPEKAPRSVGHAEHTFFSGHGRPYMSDIDAVAVIEPDSGEDWRDLRVQINEIAEDWRRENSDVPQINVEMITPSGFLDLVLGGYTGKEPVEDVPGWAWKLKAPLYIGWPLRHWSTTGEMENLSAEEVNNQLQTFLNSKQLRDAKDRVIAAIKKNVKAG